MCSTFLISSGSKLKLRKILAGLLPSTIGNLILDSLLRVQARIDFKLGSNFLRDPY